MLRYRLLVLLLCCIMFTPMAGQERFIIDSLQAQLNEKSHDTIKYLLMIEIAAEISASDTVQAFNYLERGGEIARSMNNLEGQGLYHKVLGNVRADCGDYDQAILQYDRALAYFSEAEDLVNYYETLKEKGNAYLFLSDYDQAINLYNTALDYYKRNNMVIGISRCLNNLGIIYKNRGNYVDALATYEESVRYLDTIKNAYDISQAYINMGNVFVFLGAYEDALDYYSRSLVISEKENFLENISLSLSNSGVVQNKIHNYAEAENLYRRSLITSQANNDRVQVSNCMINIGTNYADMGEPEKGLDYVERGLAIKIELEDERRISNCYIHLATIHSMMEQLDTAIILFNDAIPIKQRLGDKEGLVRSYLGLGAALLGKDQPLKAGEMVDQALDIAMEINTLEHIAKGMELNRKIALSRGDYQAAYQFAMNYHLYNDSLVDEATYRAGMEMEFRYRSKVLQQENENLRIQSDLNQALMRRRTGVLHTFLAVAALLAIGLLLGAYFLRKLRHSSTKLEEQNLVIIKQNLKLDHLNKTKDRIMSIIAHDLRGTIGNQLTAVEVLYRIEGEVDSEVDRRKLLGNLKNSASYSLELLENLLHWSRLEDKESYFHPEEVNLNMLIENCLALFDETAINKELTIQHDKSDVVLCSVDRIMMETIFRNLISNAIKFTDRGGAIGISAIKKGKNVVFSVSDEGIGMTAEQINKIKNNGGYTRRGTANEKGAGMGLTLVREFTNIHKGRLNIKSEPDKGSTFEVVIPCLK